MKRSTRTMISWTLLAAMLLSPLGGSAGHFVCSLGMAQAGPACPLCHGHAGGGQRGPGIGNSCCKFVSGRSATDARLAASPVNGPALEQSSLLQTPGFNLPLQPDRDLAVRGGLLGVSRTPTSGYRSNFLRL